MLLAYFKTENKQILFTANLRKWIKTAHLTDIQGKNHKHLGKKVRNSPSSL